VVQAIELTTGTPSALRLSRLGRRFTSPPSIIKRFWRLIDVATRKVNQSFVSTLHEAVSLARRRAVEQVVLTVTKGDRTIFRIITRSARRKHSDRRPSRRSYKRRYRTGGCIVNEAGFGRMLSVRPMAKYLFHFGPKISLSRRGFKLGTDRTSPQTDFPRWKRLVLAAISI